MDIVGKKWFYFAISGIAIIPGLISLLLFGLNLGIDYTGGTLWELQFANQQVQQAQVEQTIENNGVEVVSVSPTSDNAFLFRMKSTDNAKKEEIKQVIVTNHGQVQELQFETVGPTVSGTLTWKSFLYPIIYPLTFFGVNLPIDNITKSFIAVFWASVGILIYIAYSFRRLPKPASSFRFGVAAILSLLHDVFLVIGLFSILGKFWYVEVDALFITALLTVMGFSVHDTIVVFDRIRENLEKYRGADFAEVTNLSITQTIGRSLTTSITVLLVLLALLLFGGESIRWFVVALLAGIISGTYSSIFNAAPTLVVWDEWAKKRANIKKTPLSLPFTKRRESISK